MGKKNKNDKFYTKENIAIDLIKLLDLSRFKTVIECSAGNGSFSNSISILPIVGLSPTDKILQLDENEYKLCYMDVAQNIANELVANVFKKLK